MIAWILSIFAAFAIIPTTNRDRAVAARAQRGDAPSIGDVKLSKDLIAAARTKISSLKPIAVIPLQAPAESPELGILARAVTVSLNSDIHYLPGLLALNSAEIRISDPVTPEALQPEALAALAKQIGCQFLLTGTVTGPVDQSVLTLVLFDAESQKLSKHVSKIEKVEGLPSIADDALIALLPKAQVPGERAMKELKRISTIKEKARQLYEEAVEISEQMNGINEGDDKELATKALELAESSLKQDPSYLQPALLQASCLARLTKSGPLDRALTRAHNTRDHELRFDELTRLELDGDFYTFVKKDPAAAVGCYEKMLELDPNHMNALWMLTSLHAGDLKSGKWAGYDLNKAADYAARLVASHPSSAAARFLEGGTP